MPFHQDKQTTNSMGHNKKNGRMNGQTNRQAFSQNMHTHETTWGLLSISGISFLIDCGSSSSRHDGIAAGFVTRNNPTIGKIRDIHAISPNHTDKPHGRDQDKCCTESD